MSRLRVSWARVKGLFGRAGRDEDLDSEVQAHLDLLTEEYIGRGLSPAEAHAAARRQFGGVEQMKEVYRDQRTLPSIESIVQDFRYGFRMLRRTPVFTLAAILSLAIGIGANTAIYSLINVALFKDLPVTDPDSLVALTGYRVAPGASSRSDSALPQAHDFSYPVFRELAARQRVLSSMAASGNVSLAQLKVDGELTAASDLSVGFASANYFATVGVATALGRLFTEADSRSAGEGAVAVIGYSFWERRFGRDPSVLGRTLTMNGVTFSIIGVAGRGFHGDRIGGRRDVWIPLLMQPALMSNNMLERRTASWFRTLGRLLPAINEEQANAELTALYRQIKADEISSGTGSLLGRPQPEEFGIAVARGTRGLNGAIGQRMQWPLYVLLGVTLTVLLIACVNIANLLLARGAARQREIGIRMAIGSSRGRLIRQLLTESALLSAMGALVGLLLTYWTAQLLGRVVGLDDRGLEVDYGVLVFAGLLTVVTTLLFGLLPAIHVTAVRSLPTVFTNTFRDSGGAPRRRLARGLVVVQVGLSLWLLIGAGLLLRTLRNFSTIDVGVDRHHVLVVGLQTIRPVSRAEGSELQRQLEARLRWIPSVTSVSFSRYPLFRGGAQTAPVRVPDSAVDPENDGEVRQNLISPGYFSTIGMTLLRGRDFTDRDLPNSPQVAILNETMARHYFGDRDPIGKTVYFPGVDREGRYIPFDRGLDKARPVEIVGVVRDARFDRLRDPIRRMAYSPIAQSTVALPGSLLIRTVGPALELAALVRQTVANTNGNVSTSQVATLDQLIDGTLVGERMIASLLAAFGVVALLLVCTGLYGVTAYGVARRTVEIGVRMALGANRGSVMWLVLRETSWLTMFGVAIGVPLALGTTHLLNSLLFGVEPTDPLTMVMTVMAMLLVTLLAGAVPARRAAHVDPTSALRCD